MEELIAIMSEILDEIKLLNNKIDDIRGCGINSIDDICEKLDDIKGTDVYNTISDVCDKIDSLETTITLGDNY